MTDQGNARVDTKHEPQTGVCQLCGDVTYLQLPNGSGAIPPAHAIITASEILATAARAALGGTQ